MLLELTNIAKIQKATISLDGITVIAGENNTGKSTIGKSLYCIFNAFYNSSEKLFIEKKKSIAQYIRRYIQKVSSVKNRTATTLLSSQISDSISETLLHKGVIDSQNELEELSISTINQLPYKAYGNVPLELIDSIKKSVKDTDNLLQQINAAFKISDDELQKIKESCVLIHDEPEIHLHPKWQLIFAEVLVLLQKEFNLNILLNTHSPYFLSAIEVFSEKHAVLDKCKYYLSDADDAGESGIIITDVSGRTELIYKKLADPLQLLEDIRYGATE